MKGTRPLDNDDIRSVSTSFAGVIPPTHFSNRSFYHTGVSSETPTFGVRIFDTYRISTTNLILTLRNCGLNKRMHFRFLFLLVLNQIHSFLYILFIFR